MGLELGVWHEVSVLHHTQYMRHRQASWGATLGSVTYRGHRRRACRRHSTHTPRLFFLLCAHCWSWPVDFNPSGPSVPLRSERLPLPLAARRLEAEPAFGGGAAGTC